MPKQKEDVLFDLIHSLTRSEKRLFKIYTGRIAGKKLFVKLFDVILESPQLSNSALLSRIPEMKKSQVSNVKALLYKELLVSLRLAHVKYDSDIYLRDKMDHVRILYNKGFYRASLNMLKKVKIKAYHHQYFHIVAEIIDFEKYIESQHITHSIRERAENLSNEADDINAQLKRINLFSNLSIRLYGRYLQHGYIKNESEANDLKNFFYNNLPSIQYNRLNFLERLNLIQSYVWYHYMRQDFIYYYKYACSWVELFEGNNEMIKRFRPIYFKGLHNMLTSLFMTNSYTRFDLAYEMLKAQAAHIDAYTKNEASLLFLFIHIHAINRYFMQGLFSEGVDNIKELESLLIANPYNWDKHRIMVFRYKVACLYFGSGDNSTCIQYLTEIINLQKLSFKEDILCFSKILRLLAHYELGNVELINSEIKSVFRFLIKMDSLQGVIKEVLAFIRQTPKMQRGNMKMEFKKLRDKLLRIQGNRFEARPYLYLDIISWLESKIEGVPVQEIVQRKSGITHVN